MMFARLSKEQYFYGLARAGMAIVTLESSSDGCVKCL